ncbi:hypothetical protein DL766_002556 [Monosporascus sp. MC13-8B]|uniref:Uncharacterized protein n=1 Tax=Monosporascus cannonballus TaxID=155416 RepID=A0ABY0GV22_9PEZI|nr:hypothetical protein DL762_010007 [Monosporascus cannonballus]RYP01061.1 hypothetical protein DL763_000482 [Monosporascus cannonballus]RYP35380.1 hypothetical protein DL766_002556 [Monosporascus sp. MC13-8B]
MLNVEDAVESSEGHRMKMGESGHLGQGGALANAYGTPHGIGLSVLGLGQVVVYALCLDAEERVARIRYLHHDLGSRRAGVAGASRV